MRLKTLLVIIGILAALAAIVAVVRRPSPPPSADARINQPLVDLSTIEKATKLRISDGGKTVELVRQPDGNWRVPSYHEMPADFAKLSTFVGNLTDAKLQRLVTTTPDRIARLEFKDTKIELFDDSGKELASLTLGKTADAGGRYVRFGSEQKAFLANLQAWLDTEPKNWANSALLTLKPEDVSKIEISFPQGDAVTLTREKKEDPWSAAPTPENQTVNTQKVTSVLNAFSGLRFTETTDPTDANAVAAKANQRTVKLTTFDGKTIQVTLGRKPEEKKLKPPTAAADGSSGPAALGSVSDLTKKESDPKAGETPSEEKKPITPEYETIPAGPVFVSISHSDASAPVNELMQKRAYQISDYTFTSLPQNASELFTAAPAPTSPAPEPAK
jgi:hypothetical protein